MSFLNPWAWLWLAPLAAAIVFLYLLKLKRPPRMVSSVMLWNRVIADLQANAPFQKLRRNLLLYLQLLALLAIVGARARPFVRAAGFEGQSLAIIIDTSGSMKATDVAGARFGAAKQIALKAVDDLGRGDTMAVIAASSGTRVVSPFTSDRRALAAAIDSIECTDTTTHLEDAVRLADSLCARRKTAHIVILSDGAFPPLAHGITSHARLTFGSVGERSRNVAVTALGARRTSSGREGYQLLVGTESFSSEPMTFTIEVLVQGRMIDVREQTLRSSGRGVEVFQVPRTAEGMVEVKLDVRDDLAADNAAYVYLAPRAQASVLLVTKGDLFLERALALDPALMVTTSSSAAGTRASHDVVVVEGVSASSPPPARGYLFINSSGPLAPVEIRGEVPHPRITDWSRTDPVTRYLDLSGVQIAAARAAELKPWARSLAEADGGPVIAAGERDGVRSIYLGWDLLRSDFPLRVAFPIFLANCVDWLIPSRVGEEGSVVRAGEVARVAVPAGATSVRITDPSGRARTAAVDRSPLAIKDTGASGLYTVEGKGFRAQFAVNMLNREESNTKPRAEITMAGEPVTGARGAVVSNRDLWRWFVIAALCLIALEWAAYHRRP
jgi:hypothetical protein